MRWPRLKSACGQASSTWPRGTRARVPATCTEPVPYLQYAQRGSGLLGLDWTPPCQQAGCLGPGSSVLGAVLCLGGRLAASLASTQLDAGGTLLSPIQL